MILCRCESDIYSAAHLSPPPHTASSPECQLLKQVTRGPWGLPMDHTLGRATDTTAVRLSEMVSLPVLIKHSVTTPLITQWVFDWKEAAWGIGLFYAGLDSKHHICKRIEGYCIQVWVLERHEIILPMKQKLLCLREMQVWGSHWSLAIFLLLQATETVFESTFCTEMNNLNSYYLPSL